MLRLSHVLYGVQPRWSRTMPQIPPQWQDAGFGEAVTDSRAVTPGAMFIALSGERTDGHVFLGDVIRRGARGALVSRSAVEGQQQALGSSARPWAIIDPATGEGLEQTPPDACLLIAVDDPLMALQRLAVYHRRQLTPTVVGITGSVGKTSTKEVVGAVLSRRFRTLKSQRSFNSEATLPTTLLQLTPDHEVAVLEMGMWAAGEIRFLADLALPRIGIVTNVGPSHLERLGSIEAIAHAKAELPESLPADGWCILNADDPRVLAMRDRTKARVLTYGTHPDADIWADGIVSHGLSGIAFTAHSGAERLDLRLPLIGEHSVYLALAAIGAGRVLGMGWDMIRDGLQNPAAPIRLAVVPGINGATLIDDSYNAAPLSTVAALNVLASLSGRRIAVLGDMLELGSAEEEGHRAVGRRAAEAAQILIAVGRRARWIAEAALAHGMAPDRVTTLDRNEQAIDTLRHLLAPGDQALIKGSRGVEMEQIVAALRHHPEEES